MSSFSLSLMSGNTIYTCLPSFICCLMPEYRLVVWLLYLCIVTIGFLPGGSWSITLTSRSPYIVIARVRGIGVAVITSTWGGFWLLLHSLALCATPKRCCSSTTTSPSLLNCTVSSITACVPTRMSTLPLASPSSTVLRRLPFTMPVSSSTLMSMSPRNSRIVARCCSARISVGAIMQAWYPLSRAISIVISATRVFPLPTSPCSSLFICRPLPRSLLISLITLFWASVSENGRWSE